MLRKLISNCLIVCLLFGSFVMLASIESINTEAASTSKVTLGHAARDENRNITGGKAGDQTGKEVCLCNWSYSSKAGKSNKWKYVFRPKNAKAANAMALAMKRACANDNIGYDQTDPQRYTCYDEAKKVGWRLDKIDKKVEAHCASLMSVCINAAGINVPRRLGTPNMLKNLKACGQFEILTDAKYLTSDRYLLPGDILLSGKHTAMVVATPYGKRTTNISTTTTTNTAKKSSFKVGKTYVLLYDINLRKGPGLKYKVVKRKTLSKKVRAYTCNTPTNAILKKGTKVKCKQLKNGWMKTQYGWICTGDAKEVYLK